MKKWLAVLLLLPLLLVIGCAAMVCEGRPDNELCVEEHNASMMRAAAVFNQSMHESTRRQQEDTRLQQERNDQWRRDREEEEYRAEVSRRLRELERKERWERMNRNQGW